MGGGIVESVLRSIVYEPHQNLPPKIWALPDQTPTVLLLMWYYLSAKKPVLLFLFPFMIRPSTTHTLSLRCDKNISRTSAVSSTNFGSILIFASCVVGTCNVPCGWVFSLWEELLRYGLERPVKYPNLRPFGWVSYDKVGGLYSGKLGIRSQARASDLRSYPGLWWKWRKLYLYEGTKVSTLRGPAQLADLQGALGVPHLSFNMWRRRQDRKKKIDVIVCKYLHAQSIILQEQKHSALIITCLPTTYNSKQLQYCC